MAAQRAVVTAETLTVAPGVLGRPLAEPWRRLAAMVLDLVVVTGLSLLSRPWLGLGTGALLIVLFGADRASPLPLKTVRWVCRLLGAVVVVFSALALGHSRWVRSEGLHLELLTGAVPSQVARHSPVLVPPDASPSDLRLAVQQLERQLKEAYSENRSLRDASGSWSYQARTFTSALGVTFGWSGVYFTLVAGLLGGRSLGKFVLKTRAVRIDGRPFTFFDAFLRHGGYVAGVAMGLTGFLKLLWERNRQAVEDRIAGTVVLSD